jgi:hypothetical protein
LSIRLEARQMRLGATPKLITQSGAR